MKRCFLIVLAAVGMAGPAAGQQFDIARHCAEVARSIGGSYAIEQTCRTQEAQVKASLADRKIEPRIARHCEDVARAIGGSYQIFTACVDQEERAKRSMGR